MVCALELPFHLDLLSSSFIQWQDIISFHTFILCNKHSSWCSSWKTPITWAFLTQIPWYRTLQPISNRTQHYHPRRWGNQFLLLWNSCTFDKPLTCSHITIRLKGSPNAIPLNASLSQKQSLLRHLPWYTLWSPIQGPTWTTSVNVSEMHWRVKGWGDRHSGLIGDLWCREWVTTASILADSQHWSL